MSDIDWLERLAAAEKRTAAKEAEVKELFAERASYLRTMQEQRDETERLRAALREGCERDPLARCPRCRQHLTLAT